MALNGWLFTFPFWLIVDTIAPPAIVETEVSDRFVRVYPPFRSAPANSAYAPSLDLRNVPFPDGITVTANGNSMFVRIGVYPTLEPNSEGELGVCISLDEEFTTAPSRNFPMDSLRLDISEARCVRQGCARRSRLRARAEAMGQAALPRWVRPMRSPSAGVLDSRQSLASRSSSRRAAPPGLTHVQPVVDRADLQIVHGATPSGVHLLRAARMTYPVQKRLPLPPFEQPFEALCLDREFEVLGDLVLVEHAADSNPILPAPVSCRARPSRAPALLARGLQQRRLSPAPSKLRVATGHQRSAPLWLLF